MPEIPWLIFAEEMRESQPSFAIHFEKRENKNDGVMQEESWRFEARSMKRKGELFALTRFTGD